MKLNLKKPLAFFDLETTGTDVGKDRIVEIAIVKVMPDGTHHNKPEQPGKENRFFINPGMAIPLESSLIHGIYDEDVKNAPSFKDVADKLFKFLFDCDLGGFNSNKFDIPLLAEEFLRAGIDFSLEGRNLVDVQVIFHMMEPRNLKAAYKFYCGEVLEDAHEALPDAMASLDVFKAMLGRYENMEHTDSNGVVTIPVQNDMQVIHQLSERKKKADLAGHLGYNNKQEVIFNFGKYKAMPVNEVFKKDPGYFSWMMNAEFPLYTKKVLRELREAQNVS
ncbi:MAG: exonuclease domain-containing protein [Flavobacteriales bacterium]|nr:exonuclease domain-containing protein [Flavobacteriales bacterium]